MAAPRSWSAKEDAELARLHAEDLSLREIAKQMGWSSATISRHAADAGVSFDRSVTAAATHATVTDAKARRAALGLAMLDDLEAARSRIGKAETERQFQAAAQGMDALMRSYVNLLRMEPDDGGMDYSRSIVGSIMLAIGESVKGVPRMNPTTAQEG